MPLVWKQYPDGREVVPVGKQSESYCVDAGSGIEADAGSEAGAGADAVVVTTWRVP